MAEETTPQIGWHRHPDAPDDRCGVVTQKNREKSPKGCQMAKGYGTDHYGYGRCAAHLGNLPQNRDVAAEEQMMAMYGHELDIDPAEALLQEVRRTAGHVAWLQKIVGMMEHTDEMKQFSSVTFDREGNPVYLTEKPSFWLQLYQDERKHLAKVSKLAVDAGIAERQVRVQEQQAQIFVSIIQAILGDPDLRLTPEQRAVSMEVAKRHLLKMPRQIGHVSAGGQGTLLDDEAIDVHV